MKPSNPGDSAKLDDLAQRPVKPETAEQVRGGLAKRSGGGDEDDDLNELEVQR